MKRILTILTVLAVAGASAFAGVVEDKPKAAAGIGVMQSGNTVKVFYRGVKKNDVKVTITASDETVMYQETLKKLDNFMRPYDVSGLSAGEYTITLEDADGKQIEKLTIARPKQTKLAGVTKIANAKGKYLLRVANKGSDVLRISIFNSQRDLIYSETESVSGDFAKLYNLSQLGDGLTFEVKSESGVNTTLITSK